MPHILYESASKSVSAKMHWFICYVKKNGYELLVKENKNGDTPLHLCNIQKNYVSNLLIRLMALLEKMNKIHDC
jgi:hypothetical protein